VVGFLSNLFSDKFKRIYVSYKLQNCSTLSFKKTCDHIFDEVELSIYKYFWHTCYQEYRPLTGIFRFPPHLCSAATLPCETVET